VVVVEKEIFVSSLSFRGGKSKNKQQSQGWTTSLHPFQSNKRSGNCITCIIFVLYIIYFLLVHPLCVGANPIHTVSANLRCVHTHSYAC
jgi:hypothetical protein